MTPDQVASVNLMVEVAKAFYENDESKVEIAHRFGITRFKVARILEDARKMGVVRILINPPSTDFQNHASQIAEMLHLKSVVVVPHRELIQDSYDELAVGAARTLTELTRKGMSIGVSWGRTLVRVGLHLDYLPTVDLIQLTGSLGSDPQQSPLKVMENISSKTGGRSYALMASLFSQSPEVAARLRQEPSIREVTDRYDNLDIALISIGSWDKRITQLPDFLNESDINYLDQSGVVADCAGIFLNAEGRIINTPLDDKRISISPDQLKSVPSVLAVAGEPDKASAIVAVARAGIATHLITTPLAAVEILSLIEKNTSYPEIEN